MMSFARAPEVASSGLQRTALRAAAGAGRSADRSLRMTRVEEIRAVAEQNRAVFEKTIPQLAETLQQLIGYADEIGEAISVGKQKDGKTQVSFIPMVLVAQRQALAAYEFFSSCRPYQGWLLFRPGIEAVLIAGKWFDDPAMFRLWKERRVRSTEYMEKYSGKHLRSRSLPNSERLQAVLRRINDDYPHFNNDYWNRHLSLRPQDPNAFLLRLEYFDDGWLSEAHALAFLHLLAVLFDSFAAMFAKGLVGFEVPPRTDAITELLDPRIRRLAQQFPDARLVLHDIGLWDTANVA